MWEVATWYREKPRWAFDPWLVERTIEALTRRVAALEHILYASTGKYIDYEDVS